MSRVLTINPGGTSTKFAVFDDEQIILQRTLEHPAAELKPFACMADQAGYRQGLIMVALAEAGIPAASLQAVVGRGGLLKPMVSGTYRVNAEMLKDCREAARGAHAANLGAIIADAVARPFGIPAFIVDPVAVDEMDPEARLSGLPELPRTSLGHALNSKAVARRVAAELGKPYPQARLVVAHLGTGITVTPHLGGRMVDINTAQDEGPFSPDRCGGLPTRKLVKLCYSGKYSEATLLDLIMGSGGMYAYLGTKDLREAETRAAAGDPLADTVLRAMAHQIAKQIGAMATVLRGQVDRIILTGGMAYSKRLVDDVAERVRFLAPIVVVPGEEELPSLAAGALRVLRGEETEQVY
ncbi:MAG: butyrate kinase [Gammaproteobacteria bacterium]|nr:butyrate kinase [Gammaproteobacteria bacterium]